MTPKEKANEIFEKFFYLDCKAELDTYVCTDREYSKQCALIAVDEIISSNPCIEDSDRGGNFQWASNSYYWQQVKNEINLL